MKNSAEINRALQNHERRISALESIFSKHKSSPGKNVKKGLPDHIIALKDKGYFSQPKTAADVQNKLQGFYPCEVDRLVMALLRLSKKRQLRKAFKIVSGRNQKAYVW